MLDRILGIVGVALAVLGIVIPYKWPNLPSWTADTGVAVGCLLFGFAIGLYRGVGRRDDDSVDTAEVRFHIFGDERIPEQLSRQNIWRWYYLRNMFVSIDAQNNKHIATAVNLFLTFEKPVRGATVSISSPDMVLPQHELKDLNSRSAVIGFSAELPRGTLVVRVAT